MSAVKHTHIYVCVYYSAHHFMECIVEPHSVQYCVLSVTCLRAMASTSVNVNLVCESLLPWVNVLYLFLQLFCGGKCIFSDAVCRAKRV